MQIPNTTVWSGGADGSFVTYQVPRNPNQTALDVVTWIQPNLELNVSYGFACRVGVCGSCGMTVNGKARWTCRTHVPAVCGGNPLALPGSAYTVVQQRGDRLELTREAVQLSRMRPGETILEAVAA